MGQQSQRHTHTHYLSHKPQLTQHTHTHTYNHKHTYLCQQLTYKHKFLYSTNFETRKTQTRSKKIESDAKELKKLIYEIMKEID